MIATSQQAGRPEAYPTSSESCLTRTLPPSERDFEIYQRVTVEGQSTRVAAGQLGLSQTRIVQIRDRVAEWIGSEVPPTTRLTPAQRLVVAVDLAERRLDFLYSESMESWRERKGQPGDVRYLSQAARITERSIVVSQREAVARQAIAKAEDRSREPGVGSQVTGGQGPGVRDQDLAVRYQEPVLVEGPPAGDCSGEAAPRSMRCEAAFEAVDASDCQAMVSADAERRRSEFLAALDCDTSPVQPPITDAHGLQLEEPAEAKFDHVQFEPRLSAEDESPSHGAAMPPRPTNRKQRRARQRILEKALARRRG